MSPKPVFLFAFANDVAASLRLDEEWRQADRALQADEDAGRLKYAIIPFATRDDVWDKFNRFHNQITVFHYGGHSGSGGLNLTDSVLDGKNLATLLEQEQNLKLVFLNGCSNAGQVEGLLEKGVPAVIATSAPINDRRAINLARQFYTALCSGRSLKEAFSIAAAYVNNEEKEVLLAYRGLASRKSQQQFEWGLYAKEEAVLDWKIPRAGAAGQRRGAPGIPAWLKAAIGISLGALLLFLGYKFLWQGPEEAALDCSAGRKTAVFVTPFQNAEVDGFSSSVLTALRSELDERSYRISGADFQALNTPDYYDTIRVEYFTESCDTSGLFLSGLWDKQDSVFNCYIYLYHLSVKIPELSGSDKIILNNPPGLDFSVREDAEFLADFVIALLKVYEGEPYEALRKFYQLEEETNLLQDESLRAYVAHHKGNCYAMRGDQERAERSYQEAARLRPKLLEAALENMEVAGQIAEIMHADAELAAQRKSNITQDSLLETAVAGEPAASLPAMSEKESIEAVADELKGKGGDAVQPLKEATVPPPTNGKYTDPRDGKVYQTVSLNGKTWLAENLSYEVPDSWCYDEDPANCQKYGRLYTWAAAKKACAAMGDGWRLPKDEEWKSLAMAFGGYDDNESSENKGDPKKAYSALMEGGSDSYRSGFAALLGGWRLSLSNGFYNFLGDTGFYWSAKADGADKAWYYYFSRRSGKLYRSSNYQTTGLSCRCLQD